MFGDKKKATRPSGSVETLIGAHARICGDVHFNGGLYVEGVIEGSVIAEGTPQEILENEIVREVYLGEDFFV